MSRIEIDLPPPRHACRDVREAWPRLSRLSLPRTSSKPVLLMAVHRGLYPVFRTGEGFYASVLQGDPSTGSIAGDLSVYADRLSHFGSDSDSFRRLSAMNRDLIVVDDVACERIDEPVWTLAVSNSNFRGDRPLQIRAGLSFRRPHRAELAPSDAPSVTFRADRKDDLDAFVRQLKERHPYSTLFPDQGRCQVLAPEALSADDFAMSVRALARALTGSVHKALPLLPRAAVETWTGMRRLAEECGDDPAVFARAAETLAPLLRLPALADDPEAERWRRRARLQADMLALRLAHEPQLAADADDILADQGPSP